MAPSPTRRVDALALEHAHPQIRGREWSRLWHLWAASDMPDPGSCPRCDRRVARGGCPPRAPTDPYVRDYRIRLLGAGPRCEPVLTVSHPLTLHYPLEFW